ncbi:MAG: histidine phosphatase family protein [Actinomycetia bacterium]|nr:histidine phosphatase family protein [Actinomycetes bacterium]
MEPTIVHLLRHGQVENPNRVLYGRLPGYHLSELGRRMADRVAEDLAGTALTHLRCSPLERAQETMAPVAARHPGLEVVTDERVIEADNAFAGSVFAGSYRALLDPRRWWHLRNPLVPSWGEPYREIVARMLPAVLDAADAAGEGGQALVVSHQLPIWTVRSYAEGRRLAHDPRRRQCTLASITSLHVLNGQVVQVDYREPCQDLLPQKTTKFVAGS